MLRASNKGNTALRKMLSQQGLTSIELLVVMTVSAVLLALGLPSYAVWLQNAQVRTAAESVQSGLQLARAEAVRRNTKAKFQLTSTAGAGLSDWRVDASGDGGATFTVPVQSRSHAEGSATARVAVSTAKQPDPQYSAPIATGTGLPAVVVFNSVGKIDAGGITRVDVTSATLSAADARRLVLLITLGGQVRMCDPRLALVDSPQGCA